MLEEAKWLAERLAALPDGDLFPLLNVGSGSLAFRRDEQSYIDKHVFAPLRARGGSVTHLDLQAGEGVDVVGDMTGPAVAADLSARGFRTVICSNLLEHVTDRPAVCRALLRVTPSGGRLFVSVPLANPRHLYPIDNLFRPTPEELAACFPHTEVVDAAVITEPETCGRMLLRRPRDLVLWLARCAVPFYRHDRWVAALGHWRWLGKHRSTSCILLRKP
ncbi:hypothetical protein LCGC14_0225850 [marine sediment metagenome]|uniref:Methyltransferase type 11 domain-containing protein n=1 Tax=marine sediment metagenome TaxID=412755 RepID=A0A0F9UT08_9ZZZZ